MLIARQKFRSRTLGYYIRSCHVIMYYMRETCWPNLFVCNENIAHVMPRVSACAMMSCAHRAAHARRQVGHPNYTWHARNYLWMCHSCSLNDIYQK